MPLSFSRRSGLNRQPNALHELLLQRKSAGATILNLTLSNPTRVGLPPPLEVLSALADPAALRYEPAPVGLTASREAVARELRAQGVMIEASRIVLTASTSEAYGLLFKLLCDPGERILVPAPSYPLLDHLAAFEALEPMAWPLRWAGESWWLDRQGLRNTINSHTRALLLVSPNNPTGSYTRREDLHWMANLDLPIISDEVFSAYRISPDEPSDRGGAVHSALELKTGLVFALGGLSKLAGLPQMKLGWIALGGSPNLVDEALGRLELLADASLSLATPVQLALPTLLKAGERTRALILKRITHNLLSLQATLTPPCPASVLPVEGGWSATVRLPATRSSEEWALHLLAEQNLLVHPGAFYGFEGMVVVVLSLLLPEDTFAQGARRLAEAVSAG